jgi:hypothetical protein
MAPTLVASYFLQSPIAGNSATLVTSSFTPADGEVIVVKAQTWDTGTAAGTPSGGSLTYTSRVVIAGGGFSTYGRIHTTTVGTSPGSMAVTLSAPAASSYHSMTVERWSGAQIAASPATHSALNAGASAPLDTITTVGTNSVVSWLNGDAQSVNPATAAYRSSATNDGLADGSSGTDGVMYYAYQTAAVAGSQTYGMTLPATQKWAMAAIEIQAAVTATVPKGAFLPFLMGEM